ncbi:TPA: hypothetical protein ACIX8Y_005277, partial [Escherichia coli]
SLTSLIQQVQIEGSSCTANQKRKRQRAEPMDNCGIGQAQRIPSNKNDKTRSTAGLSCVAK